MLLNIYALILFEGHSIDKVLDIGVMVRVFSNGPGDLGSIPGRVIPKTLKMVLDASLLNTQHYKVRIKGEVEKSWERNSILPYIWCSSYRKRCLRVTLDNGRQLYFTIDKGYILEKGELFFRMFFHKCKPCNIKKWVYGKKDFNFEKNICFQSIQNGSK